LKFGGYLLEKGLISEMDILRTLSKLESSLKLKAGLQKMI
jgi:hypothetical protein